MHTSSLARIKDRVHERLLAKCEVDWRTGCWIWTGAWQESTELGVIRICTRLFTVARASFWVYRGGFDLFDTKHVRVFHTGCQVRACFNPEHLSIARGHSAVLRAMHRMHRLGSSRSAA